MDPLTRRREAQYTDEFIVTHGLLNKSVLSKALHQVEAQYPNEVFEQHIVWLKQIDRLMTIFESECDAAQYSLVDVGCGTGISTCYFAHNWKWASITGVEIYQHYIDVCEMNLQIMRLNRCEINLVRADVCDFQISSRPSVLYLFRPFGRATLNFFLRANRASLVRGKSFLMLVNDLDADLVSQYANLVYENSMFRISLFRFE